MKRTHFAVLLLVLLGFGGTQFAHATGSHGGGYWSADTIVQTWSGKVKGAEIPGFDVLTWKGIPYAAPPVGALRWKAPRKPQDWEGIRVTTEYGNRCSRDEDCLYLNVWRPNTDEKNLPVFLYIHGGSNTGGSGQGTWYTVARHFNVIVVTINYRLGPMGWFSHPALRSGNKLDDSGNFGTLDQIKALQWVQHNIRRFGGDRRNVTIGGASAGAQNVSYLMHSPLAKNLFHKALMESNFPGIRPVSAAFKSSNQVLYNLLVADGKAGTALEAQAYVRNNMTPDDVREYFHGKSLGEIRNVYRTSYWGGINWGDFYRDDIVAGTTGMPPPIVQGTMDRPEFVYCIGDGHVLPDNIDFADFSKGNGFPKPVIIGVTRNENNFWNAWWPFNYQQGKSLDELVHEAVAGTNPDYGYLQDFFDLFGEGNEDTFKKNYQFSTELIDEVDTLLGSHNLARNLARNGSHHGDTKYHGFGKQHGHGHRDGVNVYVYRFDWASDPAKQYKIPYEDAWVFYLGAPHVQEFDFFYQKFFGLAEGDTIGGYAYTDENLTGRRKLSLAARSYLREFFHDPKGYIRKRDDQPVEWRQWTKHKEQYIVFDADHESIDVHMSRKNIARSPWKLYRAHAKHPNATVRDFIEYYVMWSWHWNWYPNRSVRNPFDTSPGPNVLFDPTYRP